MRPARLFLIGVWNFIVGDDWRTAVGVVIGLGATAVVANANLAAWWVLPITVLVLLASSLRRAIRSRANAERHARSAP